MATTTRKKDGSQAVGILDRARNEPIAATGSRSRYSDADLAPVSLAWARGEVNAAQASRALEIPPNSRGAVYVLFARGLRHAVRSGMVK